ncbi:hypothetical protein [Hymenobacter pini]|uniref:hypothetical protein n=1 Tax=Hymenobacter pini TaxID=2880879 RepID=UPI001CF110E7|nr:hypothetical protein [Hymenobacter pini]MCA8830181.1 hypothetical protein [Hymenobacter pini]
MPDLSYNALQLQGRTLLVELQALPASDPRRTQLQAQYNQVQQQIRAIRSQLRQAWL